MTRTGALLFFCAYAGAASAQDLPLRPGVAVALEATSGSSHTFAVEVGADQFVHLEVFQMGADTAITVLDPGGAALAEVDDADGEDSLETVSWTRSAPGTHRVVVRVKTAVRSARLEVRLDPPRPAAPEDALWLQCERDSKEDPPAGETERAAWSRRMERARDGWRSLGETRGAMRVQLELVTHLTGKVDPHAALDSCLDVAEHFEATGDRSVEGSLNCVAGALRAVGLLDEAILVLTDLAERRRAAGDVFAELEALYNLGTHLRDVGRTSEGLALYQEGLQKARALEDTIAQGVFLGGLGNLHAAAGDLQPALDFYASAMQVSRSDDRWMSLMLPRMVRLQLQLGELEEAQATAERLLHFQRRETGVSSAVAAHRALALVLAARQRLPEALGELQRALEAARADGYERDRVVILLAMARIAMDAGRLADARAPLQQAASLTRGMGSRALETEVQVALCALADAEGDPAAGTLRCREALDRATAIHHRTGQMFARYHLARLERRQGALHSARAHLEAALALVHGQRQLLRRADLREAYATSVDDVEDEYVDLLVELAETEPDGRWAWAALEASETARGRSLRDQLANSRTQSRTDAEGRLLTRSRDLRDQIAKTLDRQLRQATGGAPHDAEPLELRLARLSSELGEVEAQIRAASPRDAAIDQPEPPGLDSMRQRLVTDESTLLFYALGARRSFLWVVTGKTIELHTLPPQARIEQATRRAVRALSRRGGSPAAPLASLSRLVLGPARTRLDAARLVVVPDGVLHYVPFGVLTDPGRRSPLMDRVEVVHLPSITAGLMLARAAAPAWTRAVALFADPVFRPDDERVPSGGGAHHPAAPSSLSRSAERSLGHLSRLPFTRREAGAIHALAEGSGSRLSLDFDATREAAVDPDLASYRFVHFATHGLIHESRPELSGIVLSLVDRDGRPRDGFLTALDTFNLRLDAELVVLSGCRTALGKDVRGEGIVGLTRAFMYAGARGTLASLWPVDDAATAELMRVFYAGMLGPRRLTPPAALREAQRHLRADARWSSPYYWGAFQLQGAWLGPVVATSSRTPSTAAARTPP